MDAKYQLADAEDGGWGGALGVRALVPNGGGPSPGLGGGPGASFELLNEVAQILIDHPELLLIRIEGHTDSRGNNAYNKDLSQRRADSVRTYLIEKGVAEDRLQSVGYGEEKPLVEGASADARAKNRRVDFRLMRGDIQLVVEDSDLVGADAE